MSRKGENIYKRKDGRWEARCVSSRLPDGKIQYHSIYARSYTEVREKARMYKPYNAANSKTPKYTFSYYTMQWLARTRLRCKLSTSSKYSNICKNHIIPLIGSKEIDKIKTADLIAALHSRNYLSPKTQNDILCVIKQIIKYAQDEGVIININLNMLNVRIPKKEMRVLSSEEQQILTEALLSDMDLRKLGIYLALSTGIRIGELCALRRKDFDTLTGILHIGSTMQRIQLENADTKTKVLITEPKSTCSIRDIPLPNSLAALLTMYCCNMSEEAFVLTGNDRNFIEPCLLRYLFNKIIKSCNLCGVHFHTLRHTFATRCVEAGVDIKTLSEILGHENVNITLNRYVHSSIDLKRESMEKLLLIINSPSN